MMQESKYGNCKNPIRRGEYWTARGEDWVQFFSRWNERWENLHEKGEIFSDVEEERKRPVAADVQQLTETGRLSSRQCADPDCSNFLLRGQPQRAIYCEDTRCRRRRALRRYRERKRKEAV